MTEAFRLDGKAIVVTGASSGIGRAAAKIMAGLGARVLLVARDGDALDAVAADIAAAGGTAHAFAADVGDKERCLAAFDEAERRLGRIDGLFANAGMGGVQAPIADYGDEDFDRVMTVNLKSLFWSLKRVLPGMIARGSGAVVATGSLASERGFPLAIGYNASKHAVLGMVRSAAAEAAPHGVRVNCLVPGFIETRMMDEMVDKAFGGDREAARGAMGGMTPARRMGTSEECGHVAAFLMSDAAAYVNGQAWAVDGGMLATALPSGA